MKLINVLHFINLYLKLNQEDNIRFIIYIIGWLLNVQGGFLLVPCIVAMIYGEKSGFAFLISAIISFIPFILHL